MAEFNVLRERGASRAPSQDTPMPKTPRSDKRGFSHTRVYLFAALYAGLLVVGVGITGVFEYLHFHDEMERRLDERLEGYAMALAARFPPDTLKRTLEEDEAVLRERPEDSFARYVRGQFGMIGTAINVPRIVIFDDNLRIVVDTLYGMGRGGIDYTLRVNQNEIEQALSSTKGEAVSSALYEIEGDVPGSRRLAKTAYAPVMWPNGPPEGLAEDYPRFIVGVELPVNYGVQLRELQLVIILVISGTAVFVISTTAVAARSFVRLQSNLEEQRRKAEHADFSSGIAHELKNPLAAMLTGIQMLERKVPASERKAFNRLERQIRSMDKIVKAFLAFARGAQRSPQTTTVKAVLAEVQKQLTPAQLRCLRVLGDIGNVEVVIDQTALVQAISNLIKNGAQAAMAKSGAADPVHAPEEDDHVPGDSRIFRAGEARVDLRVEQRGRTLVFSVTDNGGGIPPDIKARLFQPFVSGTNEGTGLGLAISRRLIDDIGGQITLTSSSKQGTSFQVEVPMY